MSSLWVHSEWRPRPAIGRGSPGTNRSCHAVLCRKQSGHVALACGGRLPPRGRRSRVSPRTSVFFVVGVVAGVPLSWPLTAGGDEVTWIGLELLHSSYRVGISQRRADWFIKWTRTAAKQKTVHMAKFEEGLGRIMYVTGALEHERPFMAPLYKFMTIHPRHSVQAVPSYVAFFLRFLAGQVEQRRHNACVVQTYPSSSAARVGAQASSKQESEAGSRQSCRTVRWDLWSSRWFARMLAVCV